MLTVYSKSIHLPIFCPSNGRNVCNIQSNNLPNFPLRSCFCNDFSQGTKSYTLTHYIVPFLPKKWHQSNEYAIRLCFLQSTTQLSFFFYFIYNILHSHYNISTRKNSTTLSQPDGATGYWPTFIFRNDLFYGIVDTVYFCFTRQYGADVCRTVSFWMKLWELEWSQIHKSPRLHETSKSRFVDYRPILGERNKIEKSCERKMKIKKLNSSFLNEYQQCLMKQRAQSMYSKVKWKIIMNLVCLWWCIVQVGW